MLIKLALLGKNGFKGPYPVYYTPETPLEDFIGDLAPHFTKDNIVFFTNIGESAVTFIPYRKDSPDWCHVLAWENSEGYMIETKKDFLTFISDKNLVDKNLKNRIETFLSIRDDILETSFCVKRVETEVLREAKIGEEVFKGIVSFYINKEKKEISLYYYTEDEIRLIKGPLGKPIEIPLKFLKDIASKEEEFKFNRILYAIKTKDNTIILEHEEETGKKCIKTFVQENENTYRDSGNRINLMEIVKRLELDLYLIFLVAPPQASCLEGSIERTRNFILQLGSIPHSACVIDNDNFAFSIYKENIVHIIKFNKTRGIIRNIMRFPYPLCPNKMVYVKHVGAFLLSFNNLSELYLADPGTGKIEEVGDLFKTGREDFSTGGAVTDIRSENNIVILCQENRITCQVIKDVL